MEYLQVGKIIATRGLQGEVKVFSTTDFGDKRFAKKKSIFVLLENEYKELKIKSRIPNGSLEFLTFDGYNKIEEIEPLVGHFVFVIKNNDDLPKGAFFHSDLIGCNIIDENNIILGVVKAVEEFPTQKTLRVSRNGNKDFFVPFIDVFILNVDIIKREIKIKVIPGLL
jgi:16S rRNA processing protein RimM